MKLPTINIQLAERAKAFCKEARFYTPIILMFVFLALAANIVYLVARSGDPYYDRVDDEEMREQYDKCRSLNGTLLGERVDRGPDMGLWYMLRCDFTTPPTTEESTNDDVATES